MKKQRYQVEIEERLSRIIIVTAENSFEAIHKIKEKYYENNIVLDADDCVDVVFSAIEADAW